MFTLSEWDSHEIFGGSMGDSERYLYHYTDLTKAMLMGESRALRCSSLERLNDPRESGVRELIEMSEFGDPTASDRAVEYTKLVHQQRAAVRVACFTRDVLLESAESLTRYDRRGFARSAMWAHYGATHSGICLVLDSGAIVAAARDALASPGIELDWVDVDYVEGFDATVHWAEIADLTSPSAIRLHHRKYVIPSLAKKNSDWQQERERRLIVDGWTSDGVCAVPLEGVVAGIVLGLDFRAEQTLDAERLSALLGVSDSIAKLCVTTNVLVPYPARGQDGQIHAWTDSDFHRAAIFDDR